MKIKAIEMTRKIRENHHNLIKNKTNDEIIYFFHERAKNLENKNKEKVGAGNLT